MTRIGRPLAAAVALCAAVVGAGVRAEAPGIDLDGMDRSVAPGDDFFALRQRRLVQGDARFPRTAPAYGAGTVVERAHEQAHRRADPGGRARERPGGQRRAQGRRLLRELHGRGRRSRPRGSRRSSPRSTPSPPSRTERGLARVLGTTLRADVDALNATNFYTDNLFGLWVAQDLDQPSRYVPFLLQGGLDMPDRDVLRRPLAADGRDPRQVPGAHRQGPRARPASRTPQARGARVFDLERRIAEAHASREDSADVKKANNHWTRESSRHVRARARLGGVLRGRGPRRAAGVRRLASRRRSPASRPWSRASRSTPGRTT